jgi:uncharacterized membrane protein YedE/YeeE
MSTARRRHALAFGVGALFALGLGLSGMTRPDKVLGFLDVAGRWDPSLAFVMGAAVLVATLGFAWTLRRRAPRWDADFHLPARTRVDAALVGGAALFGVGWGLSGYCPGPALLAVVGGDRRAWTFVAAMLVGMAAYRWLADRALTALASRRYTS